MLLGGGVGAEGSISLTSSCCRATAHRNHRQTATSAALYGAFAYLRLIRTNRDIRSSTCRDSPRVALRMLDHWDNLDGTVERGYAGRSLWNWDELPRISTRE